MINDRIQELVDKLFSGNVSAFCRATNIKQPTMNTILGERKSKPSYDIISNIVNAESLDINADWLLTGEGAMFKSKTGAINNSFRGNSNSNIQMSGHGANLSQVANHDLLKRIADLEKENANLKETIALKDKIISLLESR